LVFFKDSFHLRQALEGEYPKLLKLQNDLINRFNQLQPGFSEIEMDIIDEEFNDSEQSNGKQKFDYYFVLLIKIYYFL
jgi:hypothetical protein